jgi:hypothetical protein
VRLESLTATIRTRLDQWTSGDPGDPALWAAACISCPIRRHSPTRAPDPLKRAFRFVRLGSVGRGAQALCSSPLASPTTATLAAIQSLHSAPLIGPMPDFGPSNSALVPALFPIAVMACLQYFPAGTAAGAMGLRHTHLIGMVTNPVPQSAGQCFSALTSLVNTLAQGRAPS